jgi:PEP-CTERM motif-containing protein
MKRLVLTVGAMATVGLLSGVTRVQATPITYTETATLSGTIGGTPFPFTGGTLFTNALVTLTLTGDTSNVSPGPGSLSPFLVNVGLATINIAGVGTATFTDVVEVVSTYNTLVPSAPFNGLPVEMIATWDTPPNNGTSITGVLGIGNPAFFGYNLQSSEGPFSGPAFASQGFGFHDTSLGILHFTSRPETGTFTATASSPTPVPEPASLVLLGTGLVLAARRRFTRRA